MDERDCTNFDRDACEGVACGDCDDRNVVGEAEKPNPSALNDLLESVASMRDAAAKKAKKFENSTSQIMYAELCGEVLAYTAVVELIKKRAF